MPRWCDYAPTRLNIIGFLIELLVFCKSIPYNVLYEIVTIWDAASGGVEMTVSYNKLWQIMKDNRMKKSELASAASISQYSMTKLNQNKPVAMEVMLRLCKVFHCDIGDLMEVIEND